MIASINSSKMFENTKEPDIIYKTVNLGKYTFFKCCSINDETLSILEAALKSQSEDLSIKKIEDEGYIIQESYVDVGFCHSFESEKTLKKEQYILFPIKTATCNEKTDFRKILIRDDLSEFVISQYYDKNKTYGSCDCILNTKCYYAFNDGSEDFYKKIFYIANDRKNYLKNISIDKLTNNYNNFCSDFCSNNGEVRMTWEVYETMNDLSSFCLPITTTISLGKYFICTADGSPAFQVADTLDGYTK